MTDYSADNCIITKDAFDRIIKLELKDTGYWETRQYDQFGNIFMYQDSDGYSFRAGLDFSLSHPLIGEWSEPIC